VTSTPADLPTLLVLSSVNSNALGTALTRGGWKASTPRSFDAPLVRIRELKAAAVIVDLRDEGQAALAAIRAIARAVPVLAIVPGRDLTWITAAIDAGATHYMTSPFPQMELTEAARLIVQTSTGVNTRAARARGVLEGGRATSEISRRVKAGPVSVILLAATRFGAVNATYGRDIGDELLVAVAARVAAAAREIDPTATVARVSGAEFAVIVRAGCEDSVSEEMCVRLDRPFMIADQFVSIGCRIGIVLPTPGEDATAVLRRASAALAQARASESLPIVNLGKCDAEEGWNDTTLDADLRKAIEAGEIDVLFQPQIDVSTRRIIGVEALARWRHPSRGEIGAETLFNVAERSDYLSVLSQHIQFRAVSVASEWPAALNALRLSINLTGRDIALPEAADVLAAMVAATGFPEHRLTIEITESSIIEDLEVAAATSSQLRALGIRVAIDDFGTGYSSLAWLKALPLDYLKIDKRLAQDIVGTRRDRVVVRGAIEMARSLGIAVIAEGVETEEQLELLAAEGCNYAQGFLIAAPLSTKALIDLMA